MNDPLPPDESDPSRLLSITPALQIPHAEFQFTFSRSSGPGGQNVNKVSSKARLRWEVAASPSVPEDLRPKLLARCKRWINSEGELVVSSQRYRDQRRNIDDCLEKLRQILTGALAERKPRRPTRRTAGSVRRRLENKKQRSQVKQNRKPPRNGD